MSEQVGVNDHDGEELEPAELLEELLEEIAAGLGLDAEVEVEASPGVLSGRLVGENVGLFIGRRGQTIDAVQHLAQRIVFPEGPSSVRVQIDADGYRDRRAQLLRCGADEGAGGAVRARAREAAAARPRANPAARAPDRARASTRRWRGRDAQRGRRAGPLP